MIENSQRTNNTAADETEDYDMYENDNIQSFRPEDDSTKEKTQSLAPSKIRLSLPQRNTRPSSTTVEELLDDIKSNKINLHCKDHPDEVIQFYSFTNDKGLCSDCLLSGAYTGCEVLNLKKASDRIKSRFGDLLNDMDEKVEQLNIWEEKLANKRHDFDQFVSDCKASISDQMNRLRSAVDKKERELIDSVESLRGLKQRDVENKYRGILSAKREISEVRTALDSRVDSLKDIDLFHYYTAKAVAVRKSIEEEYLTAVADLKRILETDIVNDQTNLEENQQWIGSALENISRLKGLENHTRKVDRSDSVQSRRTKTSTRDHDLLLENLSNPLSGKKTISEELRPSHDRTKSFFRGASKDLELISACSLPIGTKDSTMMESTTDETLRRLFEKIEEVKRTPQNRELLSSKKDLRSVSIPDVIKHTTTPNTKDASPKQFWQNYKEVIEDKNRKNLLGSSTPKMLDIEKAKTTPKSFIPDYTPTKRSITAERFSLGRREITTPTNYANISGASNVSTGLISTKNLRALVQEETSKLSANNTTWRMPSGHLKTRPSSNSNPYTSKSFGTSTLSSNLKRLSREIGLGNTEFGL